VTALIVVLATLLAGGVGAVLRAGAIARAPRSGVATVNVVGTAVLALVLVAYGGELIGTGLAVVLGVGLSGSLTTFSGWMAVLVDGFAQRPWRTLLVDLLLPLVTAVGITVLAFAVLA
jgi:fluoride ion exporter CrcB/FEX